MKSTFAVLFLLSLFHFSSGQIIDRSLTGTGGSLTSAGTLQVSATLGEPVITTYSSSSIIVTQGFQQADSLYPSAIKTNSVSDVQVKVYPNPFSDELFIDITAEGRRAFSAAFYNLAGQQVAPAAGWVVQGYTKKSFSLSSFAAGNYFVVLLADGKYYKSYKIEKLK